MVFSTNLFVRRTTSLLRQYSIQAGFRSRQQIPPRRAVMYIPGNDERKVAKIPKIGADCFCLDCEDGVAFNMKEAARNRITEVMAKDLIDFNKSECTIRVNSIQSGLCEADLDSILSAKRLPSAFHLPKVDTPEILEEFWNLFHSKAAKYGFQPPYDEVGLLILIESATAFVKLTEICQKASELGQQGILIPEALVFGADDFIANIGATKTHMGTEVLYARQKLLMTAKAFNLQAIDMVYIDFKDLEGLRVVSEDSANMGFNGRQTIHPSQVPVVHQSYSPSSSMIEWATELLKEFDEHEKSGKGAFNFRGSMIDMPLVLQARNILALSQQT